MRRHQSHYYFIMHGARADLPEVRHLVQWVRDKGVKVTPRVTWEAGDATTFAREAVRAGAVDAVVAVGGDGTINEVVNGLVGTGVPLGVIPIGTANDFARQMGIPADADHAMDVILRQPARAIDVGEMNGRAFLNVSTGGIGAETTQETSSQSKERLGALAYALTGMKKLGAMRPRRAWFAGPGFEYRGEWLVFAVGNGRVTGGGTIVTPNASLEDGLLDVCIIEAIPRAEFARLTLLLRKGEHLGHPAVRYAQLPELTVESSRAMAVNLDGEAVNSRRLRYRAIKGGLLVHLPAGSMPANPELMPAPTA
jgi:lipid kinase YegS